MKKVSTYFFIVSIIFSVFFFACKKYPDGPTFSLKSKKERISNTWKIDQYKFNNADSTLIAKESLYTAYGLNIYKDGDYSFSYTYNRSSLVLAVTETGKWVFSDDKKNVIFTKSSGNTNLMEGDNYTWQILRLAEKEFWVKYTQDNNVIEVHFN